MHIESRRRKLRTYLFFSTAARGIEAEILRGDSRGDWSEEPDPEPTIGGGGACHKNYLVINISFFTFEIHSFILLLMVIF
jgi:hypothetical protein